MAWSAPPTFVVSEVVTATRMNILSDNLSYLKGLSGAVAIQDELQSLVPGGGTLTAQGTSNGSFARYKMIAKDAGGALIDWRFLANGNGLKEYSIFDSSSGSAVQRMIIDSNGNVGIGSMTAPQGKLHGYDTIGGFLHWKYDGVDGTARTVIPDGTGDVLYYATGLFQVRTSGGAISATGSTIGLITPGTAQDLYNNAGNILSFAVAANGSVTVQRTGGALTYKVNLWLLWM